MAKVSKRGNGKTGRVGYHPRPRSLIEGANCISSLKRRAVTDHRARRPRVGQFARTGTRILFCGYRLYRFE
jgi:hypothetical protein